MQIHLHIFGQTVRRANQTKRKSLRPSRRFFNTLVHARACLLRFAHRLTVVTRSDVAIRDFPWPFNSTRVNPLSESDVGRLALRTVPRNPSYRFPRDHSSVSQRSHSFAFTPNTLNCLLQSLFTPSRRGLHLEASSVTSRAEVRTVERSTSGRELRRALPR